MPLYWGKQQWCSSEHVGQSTLGMLEHDDYERDLWPKSRSPSSNFKCQWIENCKPKVAYTEHLCWWIGDSSSSTVVIDEIGTKISAVANKPIGRPRPESWLDSWNLGSGWAFCCFSLCFPFLSLWCFLLGDTEVDSIGIVNPECFSAEAPVVVGSWVEVLNTGVTDVGAWSIEATTALLLL